VSGVAQAGRMKKALRAADVEGLLREIQRYLAYVDAFRAKPPQTTKQREDENA
jgi:hypothetical protein